MELLFFRDVIDKNDIKVIDKNHKTTAKEIYIPILARRQGLTGIVHYGQKNKRTIHPAHDLGLTDSTIYEITELMINHEEIKELIVRTG